MSLTEKNLQAEPQLEGKRQEMLYKVQCGHFTLMQTHNKYSCWYREVHDACSHRSLNSWPRWSRPLRRGCRGSMNSARQGTRHAALYFVLVTAACSPFWFLKRVSSLLELQSQRSAGPLKSRSPPGRGGVRGNGRKLLGGTRRHRWILDKLHGEENSEEAQV